MTASFVIAPLTPDHDRLAFSCGVDPLDRYLQTQATQDIRRRIANCFVATLANSNMVAGYYTLSAASVPLFDLPSETAKRLPRYPVVPAAASAGWPPTGIIVAAALAPHFYSTPSRAPRARMLPSLPCWWTPRMMPPRHSIGITGLRRSPRVHLIYSCHSGRRSNCSKAEKAHFPSKRQ